MEIVGGNQAPFTNKNLQNPEHSRNRLQNK